MRTFITAIFILTILSGLVYASVQQSLRQSANDPQIQIAEDLIGALAAGAKVENVIPVGAFDISKSLAPFVIITDANGKVVKSSAMLNNESPVPPMGSLLAAKNNGENRITWEPASNARSAIVITHYTTQSGEGYVIAGRSLRETEKRESMMLAQTAAAWIVGIIGSFIIFLFFRKRETFS